MKFIIVLTRIIVSIFLLFHVFKVLICKPLIIPALTRTEDTPTGSSSGKALLPAVLERTLSFSNSRRGSTNSSPVNNGDLRQSGKFLLPTVLERNFSLNNSRRGSTNSAPVNIELRQNNDDINQIT